ncbi:uncharacterized protein FIBRA_05871 [Fibroporia radiculosa]|uniref:Uncharacterized protein n=1 Tax=Fibroporia radiculosa TaxID=599839 RepID=J4GRS0_9APHY|nr:uncharacterized protein FIBRA_05871 [Fibroporia radiculosa]CCM03725.1 predicted protein [Fibroporia radiculosa]
MLVKFGALIALLPLVAAQCCVSDLPFGYTFSAPTDWVSGEPASLTWTASIGDPTQFAIILNIYNQTTQQADQWVLANYVESCACYASFTLPDVPPASGYDLIPSVTT